MNPAMSWPRDAGRIGSKRIAGRSSSLLTRVSQPATVLELSPVVWQVLATAGFAGGFVYWLLAGRTA